MKNTEPSPHAPGIARSRPAKGLSVSRHPGLALHLPVQLRNLRAQRYIGDSLDASLSVLSRADQDRIRLLYGYAKGVHLGWLAMRDAPVWDDLRALVLAILAPPLSSAAKELGRDTLALITDNAAAVAMGKVLHDVRGGALMSLQLYAHMAQWDADPAHLRSAAFLARDQAKIMRNALPDLDPDVRSADEAEKPHHMQTVVEKWDMFRFDNLDGQPGQVDVTCHYAGLLASCCLEASAVDRIIYNYVNNAVRFSAGPSIQMDIGPVGGNAVRWLIANPITDDQSEWLMKETRGDLSSLFRGGLTRGGNGLGLSNCADFVAAAFGLPDTQAALEGKYLGAAVEDNWYVAWAHWPSLYPDGPGMTSAAH